jgi:hypothetical protein
VVIKLNCEFTVWRWIVNRSENRWQRCYWKEWAAIKKRWDKVHASWRELAADAAGHDSAARRNKGGSVAVDHPEDRLQGKYPNDPQTMTRAP